MFCKRKAHAIFIQEQSPTDPDSAKPAAGVGLVAAQGIRCTNPTAQTEKLAFFRQQGRADICNIDMGSSTARKEPRTIRTGQEEDDR